ncbi:dienelactone hydrolase family protein [Micromonospora sp. NPDC049679]|uniref:dienelactone hydrolase family protein n=1 Tax=Micromonospora sp. NPDC049679 TaxID=3155920 RepID=UPI0033DC496E
MAHIVLFHSVYGRRPAVIAAAERLRAAGHHIRVPDLYAGETADRIDEAFVLRDRVGEELIVRRAREALRDLPADAVLAGFSMGAGIAQRLLLERPDAAALLLLHGTAEAPALLPDGLPVQLHVAEDDEFEPAGDLAVWQKGMVAAGADVELFIYPDAGHLYTDPQLPDHEPAAAALTWRRALDFLASV